MKKLMSTILVLLFTFGTAMYTNAQAPTTFAFGALLTNDGTKDFGWFYGGNFSIIKDEARGLANYGRVGYFRTYTAVNEEEVQSAAGWNITQKSIKTWAGGRNNLYLAVKVGALFDFEEGGDDNVNAGIGLEWGAQFGSIAYLGLGADYQPIVDGVDKEFVYAIVNLFP